MEIFRLSKFCLYIRAVLFLTINPQLFGIVLAAIALPNKQMTIITAPKTASQPKRLTEPFGYDQKQKIRHFSRPKFSEDSTCVNL
jgi:hypothetical protein